jgi:hypothetical protein
MGWFVRFGRQRVKLAHGAKKVQPAETVEIMVDVPV